MYLKFLLIKMGFPQSPSMLIILLYNQDNRDIYYSDFREIYDYRLANVINNNWWRFKIV